MDANTYKQAITNCANAIKSNKTDMNAFELSTALAVAFAVHKVQVMEDILNVN